MTAGLPGSGIGGLFYVLSALFIPVRELWRALRTRSMPERPVLALQQTGLAVGIIIVLWWTGWVIDALLIQPAFAEGIVHSARMNARVPSVFRVSALAISLGTLASVVAGTRLLAAVVERAEPRRDAARKRTAERQRRVASIVLAAGATLSPILLGAQSPDDARRLSRAGQRDAAIVEYERWVQNNPRDFAGWRDLGVERMRAERYAEAIAAFQQALELREDEALRSRLEYARSRMGYSLVTAVNGSRDSDGVYVLRGSVTGDGHLAARWRYGVSSNRLLLGAAETRTSLQETNVWTRWRPLHAVRMEAAAGAVHGLDWMARLRARWTAPANGPMIDVRLSHAPLTNSEVLVTNRVVLEEAQATLETPGRLRARGTASIGNLKSAFDSNQRRRLGGGLVFRATPLLETSISAQHTAHTNPNSDGYFGPAHAQLAEFGTYAEFYGPGDVAWAFDAGAGLHRYTQHDTVFLHPSGNSQRRKATATEWAPALRAWGQVTIPLRTRAVLMAEADYYQSAAAAAVAASADWRFFSAGLSVRWYLQSR